MQDAVIEWPTAARRRLRRGYHGALVIDSVGLAGAESARCRIGDAIRCFGCGSPGLVMERKLRVCGKP